MDLHGPVPFAGPFRQDGADERLVVHLTLHSRDVHVGGKARPASPMYVNTPEMPGSVRDRFLLLGRATRRRATQAPPGIAGRTAREVEQG